MISGYFTNKSLCLGPRFWDQISGFIFFAKKKGTQKYFLVATIYDDFVGGLVETLFTGRVRMGQGSAFVVDLDLAISSGTRGRGLSRRRGCWPTRSLRR